VDELAIRFEFMGKQQLFHTEDQRDYIYFGFRRFETLEWRIARKDTTDDSNWQYAYGTTVWSGVWEAPLILSGQNYGEPPTT
jgi:hypothetical protein